MKNHVKLIKHNHNNIKIMLIYESLIFSLYLIAIGFFFIYFMFLCLVLVFNKIVQKKVN